ncbi:MAG: hypothetical protein ACOYOU_06380 [Kiritimatiellia bacterium]
MRQRIVESCIAMTLASAALVVALRTGVATRDSLDVLQGVCRELLSGSTEGRQALVGSCWYGPLPLFISTVFAWFGRFAGVSLLPIAMTAWFGWSLAIYRLGCLIPACRGTRLLAQLAAAAGIAACGGAVNPAVALPVWLGVQAAGSCADWAATRRMGALATLGFTLGALVLCGVSLTGWVVLLMLALAMATLLAPDVRCRLPAVLVLGWLPLFYALAVWTLINWLLLGHPLFFVQSLGAANVLAWQGWPASGSIVSRLGVVIGAAAVVLALVRRRPDGVVLGLLGVGAWVWAHVLGGYTSGAADPAAGPLSLLLGVAALLRTAVPPPPVVLTDDSRTAVSDTPVAACHPGVPVVLAGVVLAAMVVGVWRDDFQTSRGERLDQTCRRSWQNEKVYQAVSAYVQDRTPHGRVFVCGYEGLGLLNNRPADSRLLPNMDLHIYEMRRQYHGQQLFVLIRRPEGHSAADSVHWRFPDAFRRGFDGAIFARNFGDWRLFEVIGAPTAEQLRAWRR